ncbi:molecular chaperone [Mycolicibacterium wolinskyi]|uniref:Molecular chaperone n=1 Tax=Mycolicibacterium wolinskyi TaxID=59750 RepID=A0A132PK09_9MYCO|nr:Hsp70 family protein [Mycolicibacterium wolinskyi]KWX22352.1 molecular chaperone [Mycolicibacterium wolinskyi]
MADGIGLSVGATNLTAVVVGRAAVTRSPVLTLYPHRASEVGVPSENPNLTERGLILTDFVDRVGDPVGILAPDGSSHRGETLVADALGALLDTVTAGRQAGDPVAVTHPAHWRPNQVEALRAALAAMPEFRDTPSLVSDATAALTALQDEPGVPTRGVIAVCDFGGSGTSITLADAGNGYQPIAPTVRHPDLSGDLIDQALLTHVVNDLSAAGTIDLASTSAIGSLGRLRGECRRAKERLSVESVTALVAELPGHRSDVRLNRNELDDAIREPLDEFVAVLQDTVDRSGLRPGDLVAVATIGGGARIPAITTTLSAHFRVPVITGAQPELTAAIGGGLTAVRGTVEEGMTAMAPSAAPPTAAAALVAPEPPAAPKALAWSDAQDIPDVAEVDDYDFGPEPGMRTTARPQLQFGERELTEHEESVAQPWYRRRAVLAGAGGAAALVAVAAVLLMNNRDSGDVAVPAATTAPVTTTTAPSETPPPAVPVEATAPEPQQTQVMTHEAPPPQTVTQTVPPPAPQAPPVTETPQPTTETPPPPPPTTTEPPPATTQAPTSTQPPWSPAAPYPTIPGLPWVPAPGGGGAGGAGG